MNNINKELLESVSEIMVTKYTSNDNVNDILEDLINAYNDLESEFNDYKTYVEDNYSINYKNNYEEYGISERDFY